MSLAEQTVTWLITLGVLESPKKSILDPEGFLHTSLRDGVVLCRLLERLSPGATEKVHTHAHTHRSTDRLDLGPLVRVEPLCGSLCVRNMSVRPALMLFRHITIIIIIILIIITASASSQ
ncbi:hypothetical protein CRUP_027251 [Coryphaenoides rupestris]|nr:hypothetical protein CRUP_027251 [Coryphaenoides rupestris]